VTRLLPELRASFVHQIMSIMSRQKMDESPNNPLEPDRSGFPSRAAVA
jgi:hypothetical protein